MQNDKMRRAAKMRVKLFLSEFQAPACKKNVMLLVSPHVGFLAPPTSACARKVSRYRRRLIKARNKREQLAGRFHLISRADLRRGRGSKQAASSWHCALYVIVRECKAVYTYTFQILGPRLVNTSAITLCLIFIFFFQGKKFSRGIPINA